MKNSNKKTFTFIDLFAGCGGLSEGFLQLGFKGLFHIDIEEKACETLSHRLKDYGEEFSQIKEKVLNYDLTNHNNIDKIIKLLDRKEVDVLLGGPPCQAFSSVGRAQDPNSMKNDKRNYLYKHYIECLTRIKPKIFIFENVTGLLTSKPNGYRIFPEIIKEFEKNGYDVYDDEKELVLNSVNYGVPQLRKRVILIGIKKELNIKSKDIYNLIEKTHYAPGEENKKLSKFITVEEAISDLPKLFPGEGKEEISFKSNSNNDYIKIMRQNNKDKLFNHVARKHNEKDRERYKLLSMNNWLLKDLVDSRPDLVNYDPDHFINKYKVQRFDKPSLTILAHLSKDGNLFIHPDYQQERTFTVREAARIQSFPDDFQFIGARTNQYKQIGNAVPPLMSKAIAKAVKKVLGKIYE